MRTIRQESQRSRCFFVANPQHIDPIFFWMFNQAFIFDHRSATGLTGDLTWKPGCWTCSPPDGSADGASLGGVWLFHSSGDIHVPPRSNAVSRGGDSLPARPPSPAPATPTPAPAVADTIPVPQSATDALDLILARKNPALSVEAGIGLPGLQGGAPRSRWTSALRWARRAPSARSSAHHGRRMATLSAIHRKARRPRRIPNAKRSCCTCRWVKPGRN